MENKDKIFVIDLTDNYYKISNNIFNYNLSVYELSVYNCLSRFSNNSTKKCYPSITRICKMISVSRPKVINSIKVLIQKKIIYREKKERGSFSTYYLLDITDKKNGLVNEVYQGSKSKDPEVVNVVNSNKTNINKTNLKKLKDHFFNSLLPDKFKNDDYFIGPWIAWLKYRAEIKKKIVKSTAERQIKFLSNFDSLEVGLIINQSITNGWIGLFPIKKKKELTGDPHVDKMLSLKDTPLS